MADLKNLDQLKPIADEMLAGLHADDALKRRIREAALTGAKGSERRKPSRPMPRVFVPALCCAALAVACVGVVGLGRTGTQPFLAQIQTITAGGTDEAGEEIAGNAGRSSTPIAGVFGGTNAQLVADLGDGASVRSLPATDSSLFASTSGDIPLVAVSGAVYRMLSTPQAISQSLCGSSVGQIATFTEEPSLASDDALSAGLSNVAGEGSAIYSISGLDSQTAVAAEVNGSLRVFQRVSYAGKGPGAQSLEDTFGVRAKASALELSGVGTLTGEAANAALAVLLDNATLVSADASARRQVLTVTLDSGLKLQLGVSGDTVVGCGGWSCPEFFEAFEAAL